LYRSFNALITASLTISIAEFIHLGCPSFARFSPWIALQVFSKVFKHVFCPAVALNRVLHLVLCPTAQQLILFVSLVFHRHYVILVSRFAPVSGHKPTGRRCLCGHCAICPEVTSCLWFFRGVIIQNNPLIQFFFQVTIEFLMMQS
jgi:hypothetical protein